ncbi:hypothetical protein FA15DRAFT_706442 [Coprinopsis marcescibilis]|uniref:Amidohydrolase-related domain-containing protein n=1 Tax=Coprinopsis marcescibilis TaxID=230819 RepID=A0A5C3KRA3_COPMA|nr:hypothetical protein FA15DRAFT_706442 [Coprinopsis marcescibilis]
MSSKPGVLVSSPHPFAVSRPFYRRNLAFSVSFLQLAALAILLAGFVAWTGLDLDAYTPFFATSTKPAYRVQRAEILARCAAIRQSAGPPPDFWGRDKSDRFERGTNGTLIRNAKIFTGENNGTVVIYGDLLLDKGIIRGIGDIPGRVIDSVENLTVIQAHGAWVTPGLVDLHSHIGLVSSPVLSGAIDVDSPHGPIVPWLRSIDALNTHDDAFQLAMAGGVTTVQVLPGSNNAIGGQSFFAKLRKTSDRSASSMIVEPPSSLTGEDDFTGPPRWRHMKQACGENLKGRAGTRMDTMWALRSAYNQARKVMHAQDDYCQLADAGLWDSITGPFPDDLQWEILVDVLRGKVKISNHCYEAVDLDALIRLTNEFKFPIASIHHAAEAWLVPDVLKRAWGSIPTVALFATTYRFKREAYRGSEYAPRVLADAGIHVAMKSDHPVLNSRYLAYEAQQAHYFGLQPHLALASITSTPAIAAGLSHRIGILQKGADADVVLWDSHPLQLGATPVKVWIDGIPQVPIPPKSGKAKPIEIGKGKDAEHWRRAPPVPNWDKEREEALQWEGLPPLKGRSSGGSVMFTNVTRVWTRTLGGPIEEHLSISKDATTVNGTLGESVVVENGKITCIGQTCATTSEEATVVDLKGGTISPGLMSYGSPLGLQEIAGEPSTADGALFDALKGNIPKIMDDSGGLVRAVDALMFETRDALTAYRSGVTLATSSLGPPNYIAGASSHFLSGLSTAFRTGAAHAMEPGAIVQEVVALHVVLGRTHPMMQTTVSVSTQIAGLRRLLHGWESRDKETGYWFRKAAEGVVPLVVEVDSADIMASLLILKTDVEDRIGSRMRMVFSGAAEAHLLARQLSVAGVGVILCPARQYPMVWDQRRILPGPPITNDTALVKLLEEQVVVGLGVRGAWEARHARFDIQWAALESNGRIQERQAYALVTTELEKLLGVREIDGESADLVAVEAGTIFNMSSKIVGVISAQRGVVDYF